MDATRLRQPAESSAAARAESRRRRPRSLSTPQAVADGATSAGVVVRGGMVATAADGECGGRVESADVGHSTEAPRWCTYGIRGIPTRKERVASRSKWCSAGRTNDMIAHASEAAHRPKSTPGTVGSRAHHGYGEGALAAQATAAAASTVPTSCGSEDYINNRYRRRMTWHEMARKQG